MASKIDATYFRLGALQPEHRRLVHATGRWLEDRLDEHCYVSFSAGKDSMVVAHLCAQLRPQIPLLMVDPGVPVHWTEEDRERMLEYTRESAWNLTLFEWDKFANVKAVEAREEKDYRDAVHEDQFLQLSGYAQENGLIRRITGMRAAESKTRRKFLTATRGETESTLQPLWNWSTDDVWTYTVSRGMPWLSIYDHLGPEARNGLIGKNGREHGRLIYLKRYYPEAFKMACKLFGAREYV